MVSKGVRTDLNLAACDLLAGQLPRLPRVGPAPLARTAHCTPREPSAPGLASRSLELSAGRRGPTSGAQVCLAATAGSEARDQGRATGTHGGPSMNG